MTTPEENIVLFFCCYATFCSFRFGSLVFFLLYADHPIWTSIQDIFTEGFYLFTYFLIYWIEFNFTQLKTRTTTEKQKMQANENHECSHLAGSEPQLYFRSFGSILFLGPFVKQAKSGLI